MFTRKIVFKTLGLLIAVAVLFAALLTGEVKAQAPSGLEFVVRDGGTIGLSTEQFHSSPSSVKLTTTGTDDAALIRFTFEKGELQLKDITTLSYWQYIEKRENPLDVFVDIWLDFDGDGVATTNDFPGYMQAEPIYSIGVADLKTWTKIDAFDLTWETYVNPEDYDNPPTLSQFQTNNIDPKWTNNVNFGELDVLRIHIRAGYGGTWKNFVAYADDIQINSHIENFPNEVWVDDDDVTCGGNFPCFASIQDGIDMVAEGGKVHVYPGTYNENITIDKAGITLKSTGTAEETIINADKGFGVYILKDLGVVTIDGFTVKGWQTIGIVQGTAYRDGTTPHVLNNIVIGEDGDEVHGNGIQVTGNGSLVQGNTVTGAYYMGSGPYGATGILAYAGSNVTIRGNTVSGADIGIGVAAGGYHNLGPITGVLVEGNEVYTTESAISVQFDAKNTVIKDNYLHDNLNGLNEEFYLGEGPNGTVATRNKVVNNVVPVSITQFDETPIPEDHIFDASPNWWGSPCGPTTIEGDGIVYSPWYIDEEMTTTTDVPPVSGEYTFPTTMGSAEKNAIVTCAAPGTEFTFEKGEHAGGIVIDNDYLTFNLNGATIGPGSPAFTISGDNTIINGPGLLAGIGTDHAIFVEADVTNLTVNKLEIKNWTDGVHYEGKITNTQVVDSYFHELTGDAIHFTQQPIIETPLSFYIQGNMFLMESIGGFGVNAPEGLDVTYNSWGDKDGPGELDLPAAFEEENYKPFTHVDISMVSTNPNVNNWPNQVFVADSDPRHDHETITYQVKANLVNVTGADFVFDYPEDEVTVKDYTVETELFKATAGGPILKDEGGKLYFLGETAKANFEAVTALNEVLFTVTFEGKAPGKDLPLDLDDLNDEFAMYPGYGPSHNIYAYKLEDGKLDVIDRPTLEITGLDTPFVAGVMSHEIENKLCNPPTGGEWTNRPSPDAIGWIRITNITLDKIASLQFKYEGVWYDFEFQNWAGGDAVKQDGDDVIARFGNYNFGFDIPLVDPQWCDIDYFRVTFKEPGTHDVTVEIYDMMDITPADGIDPEYILLTYSGPHTITITGGFDVKGTISMQGRTVRAGVPLTLTDYDGEPIYGPYPTDSGPELSYNVLFTGLNGGIYELTTNQPRYLNLHTGLKKLVFFKGAATLEPLELKGGNAVWTDNVINLSDASKVGGEYGWTGDPDGNDADVNFDGRVSIQDLAMVGGNYELTSKEAYADWTPIADDTEPELVGVTPNPGVITLGANETFVLTVQASDAGDNLYKLEIDHSLEATLPEFNVYANPLNPYGSASDKAQFEGYGVYVSYDAAEMKWVIDFGTTITPMFKTNGITFYLVLHDFAGNQWGTMYGTTPENTFAYTFN